MEFKKYLASVLTALMALSVLAGVGLATPLNRFPGFLATATEKASELNAAVIVGADAKTADVVAAIDLAATLAGQHYSLEAVGGAVAWDGVYKEGTTSELSNEFFGKEVKPHHFSVLKDVEISYEGENYRIVETLTVPSGATGIEAKNHDEEGNDINGYYQLVIPTGLGSSNGLRYKLEFKEDIDLAGELDRTLDIDILGTSFRIIMVNRTPSMDALVGEIHWLAIGESVTIGEWKVSINSMGEERAEVAIYKGNVLKKTAVLKENEETSVEGFKVRVLDVYLQKYPVETGKVKLIAGTETRKTFKDGDEFPGNKDWTLDLSFASDGKITAGDYITVYFDPEDEVELKEGESVEIPGGYGVLKFAGPTKTERVTVEFKPVSNAKVYTDDTFTSDYGSLPLLEIAPSKEWILSHDGEDYKKLWLAYNSTATPKEVVLVAYDDSEGKYYAINKTELSGDATLDIKAEVGDHVHTIQYFFDGSTEEDYINIDDVVIAYFSYDRSGKWKLGATKAEAEAEDVVINGVNEGTFEKNFLDGNSGIIVQNVKGNAENDKVVVSLPGWEGAPEFGVGIGKPGAEAGAGVARVVVEFTSPLGFLDTDPQVSGLKTGSKPLVLVGGPAVNRLTAELYGLSYPTYGGPDTAEKMNLTENVGVIDVVDDAFGVKGKTVLVVAGWEAPQTRLAASVLQNYATKLKDVTASRVILKGTDIATVEITPA